MIPFPGLAAPVKRRCADCGHWMTSPAPPERSIPGVGEIGPECAEKRGIVSPASPRFASRRSGPVDGQQDLMKINEGESMTATTAERETKPCWVLVYGTGVELDTGDGVPHYPTEERAALEAPRNVLPSWGVPTPKQLDRPCFEISGCGGCEEDFGDNYGGEHFESREQAEKAVKDAGWEMAEDGTVRCDVCVKDCDCREGEDQ